MPRESELKKLSEEQKATVLGWIDDGETLRGVIEKIGKAEPEGFGIQTNLGTLSRMVAFWRSAQLLKARPEEAERARALLKNEAESIAFQRATIAVLQQRLFQSAVECRDGREQRETLRMLLEHEIKIRKVELAEKKLEESKRQFEFNAARLAIKHWHEFREIDEMEGPDDEEKIWMARDAMFVGPNGESPVKPGAARTRAEESSRPQISKIEGEKKSRAEVMHKPSTDEGEKSSTDGVKIENNSKSSGPAEAGTKCGGGRSTGEMTNDNGTNDKGKPNDKEESGAIARPLTPDPSPRGEGNPKKARRKK